MFRFLQIRSFYRLILIALLFVQLGCHVKGGFIHRVESGETLWQLAHVYEVELIEILRANPHVKPEELQPGQKLLIPGSTQVKPKNKSMIVNKAIEEPMPSPTPLAEVKKSTESVAKKKKAFPMSESQPKFAWPATGKVISKFGKRNKKMHNGIDIRVKPDSEISASCAGKVVYQGNAVEGYGNLVIIRHTSNIFTIYAYLGEILCKKGGHVKQGYVIAKALSNPEASFLHFEIRRSKIALDPLKLLPTAYE